MRKALLFLLSLLIGLGLFIWILKFVGWRAIENAFSSFTGWQGLAILGLTTLMAIIGTWKWREILKGEEVKISFWDLLKPSIAGYSIMFLAPILVLGAEVFRAYALKEKKSVPWPKGMASGFIDLILEYSANLVVVFLGILFFLYKIGFPSQNLVIIFSVIFLLFTLAIAFFYFKALKRESVAKSFLEFLGLKNHNHANSILETEKEIFNFFGLRKKSMWKSFGLTFLRAFVMYLRTWVLILFLGKNLGGLLAFSLLSFTYIAVTIPIPAALGSHEAVQTIAFNSLGLGAPAATVYTMIIRGAELIVALVGVIFLFQIGWGLAKRALLKK
jgi:uncharacterized protein (TIRG00374 family)